MIEWRDTGVILRVRKHGETSVIVDTLTANHGRAAGVVRGGTSRKMTPILQPGSQVDLVWKARLEEHLGSLTVEPLRSRSAQVMGNRLALAGLNAVTALLCFLLPDREAHSALFARTERLLDLLGQDEVWPLAYLQWEMLLLAELGFALDLKTCAVTGSVEGLAYISPKSGRAVSADGAGEWADKLLRLPPVLIGAGDAGPVQIAEALAITGFFLTEKVAPSLGDRALPEQRARLIDQITRLAA